MTYYGQALSGGTQENGLWTNRIYKQGADSPVNKTENTYVCEYERSMSLPSMWLPMEGYEQYGPMYSCWIDSKKQPWTADALTLNSLYAKAADMIRGHEFNAGIMAAESKEALGTVVQTFRFLGRAYKSARRGDAGGFARAFKDWSTGRSEKLGRPARAIDIPNAHLNFTYAISPLIADLQNAWEAFTRTVSTEERFVARHGFTERGDIYNGPNRYYPPIGYMLTTTKVRTQLIVKVHSSLSTADSYGLTDWKSILWERVPLSFVVDWVIPIGTALSNLHMFRNLGYTYVQTVHYKRQDHWVRQGNEHMYAPWIYVGVGSSCNQQASYWGEYGRIDRTHGSNLVIPLPGIKTFQKAASPAHVVNAAALVWSIIGSMKGH